MKLTMHRPAIVMNRIGAFALDLFLISLLYGVIVAVSTKNYRAILNRFDVSTGDFRYDLLIAFILISLYFVIVPLLWNGYTVGKRLTRTRLVKANGGRVGIGTLIGRLFLILIPNMLLLGIPALVNIYLILFRQDNSGYHDLVAKTKVISVV
ncbi:RDD family protein [Microbacteriaceae bacterium 4G12]